MVFGDIPFHNKIQICNHKFIVDKPITNGSTYFYINKKLKYEKSNYLQFLITFGQWVFSSIEDTNYILECSLI